jgi:hypothetical protein
MLHRDKLDTLGLIVDRLSLGRPPRRDPSLKVDDRFFPDIHMKRPDGSIRVRDNRIAAH